MSSKTTLSCHVTDPSLILLDKFFGIFGDINRIRSIHAISCVICVISETAYTLLKYYLHKYA